MPRRSSVLLINEPPLQALPSLACLVGINGAIILQQVHYWLQVSEHQIEGYTWIYNSYDKWAKQFKWLKPRGVQYQILELEKSGYLITRQFKYKAKNNTKWYRIDYGKLDADYNRLIDCWKSNSDSGEPHAEGWKSNSDCWKPNHDDTPFQQSLKLNSKQNTQENTHKTITRDIEQIWQETLVHLKEMISPINFKTWLVETAPTSFDGTLFLVSAKNKFIAEHVNETMRSMVEAILTEIVGSQVKFKCQEGEGSGGEE